MSEIPEPILQLPFFADRTILSCDLLPEGRTNHNYRVDVGDQAFFVRRAVFERIGGYRNLPFLEDVEFLRRLRGQGRFSILKGEVTTSSRRFRRRGIVRQQLWNILIVSLYELGVPVERLQRLYPNIR